MATDKQIMLSRRDARELQVGDLLKGWRVYNSKGVVEWWGCPRYRVVALHMDGETFFVDVLAPDGYVVGTEIHQKDSDCWDFF